MSGKQITKVEFTEENADEMVEMFREGKEPSEICAPYKMGPNQFDSLMRRALFDPVEKRTPELQILRDGILKILLAEGIIGQALRILSKPQVTMKETELLALSAQEKKGLERKGYEEFIKSAEKAPVLLKVERTTEPPPVALLEKLLKLVEGDVTVEDVTQQLVEFAPVDPRLADVLLFFMALPAFLSFIL